MLLTMIKEYIIDILSLKKLSDGSKREAIWLWLAFAVWLPFVLSGIIIVAVFFVIVLSEDTRAELLKNKRMLMLSCAIGGITFLSAVFALNFIGILISFGVYFILICGCYIRATVEKLIWGKCCAILAFGSIAAAISAVIQRSYYQNNDYRPTAGAMNANYYGALIVFTLIMAAVKWLEKDCDANDALRWYHLPKWFWFLVCAVNIFALLYSRSRSSLLAFMVCVFVYLVLSRRYVLSALCAVCFAGVWAVGYFRPDIFNWQNTLTYIFEERFEIWKSAWQSYTGSIRSVLIGRGPMTYYVVMDEEGLFSAHHAHNVFLDTLLNVGIVGLVLYALLLWDILKRSLGNLKNGGKEWLIAVIVIVEILVQGVADVTIMWIQTGIMFMLIAFPVISVGKKEEGICDNIITEKTDEKK